MALKVLLAGGGTGGHVYPLIAVAEALLEQSADTEIRFIGTGELLHKEVFEAEFRDYKILAPKWRRYFSFYNFLDFFKIPIGFLQTFFIMLWYMPDVVFAKGGYGSFFPLLMAKIMFIPVVVHDSDSVPGAVNRWFGRGAKRVFLGFEEAKQYFKHDRVQVVGNPLRKSFLKVISKDQAQNAFNVPGDKPVLFITGATSGAQEVNDSIILSLVDLTKHYYIIHQCGTKSYDEISKRVEKIIQEEEGAIGETIKKDYKVYASFNAQQMAAAYSAADVVISRSGSNVFDLAALSKPSILVPLPTSASNHQFINAQVLSKYGAIVITEKNFTTHILLEVIAKVYENRFELSTKIKEFAKLDAGNEIARYLLGGK
ncbi:MAG: UDP-N-acetylglucosamine--N-acetylmuramyl-(pentapeptide) pyrophosphoryl-undecaprenol N-acetylglucosamine transferase [Parcubacteria group bacterium]